MSQAPSMPFFIDAYLADTSHLTTEEHGAYTLLLFAMWRRGGEALDDDKDNARITRLSLARWRKVKPRLVPFLEIENGKITQKRLKKEWDYVAVKRAKNIENGAKGGRPRTNENNDIAKANGSVEKTQTKANPLPYPLPLEEQEESKSSPQAAAVIPIRQFDLVADLPPHMRRTPEKPSAKAEPDSFPAFYAAYPLHKSRKAAAKAYAAALSRASPEALLAGAQRYAAARATEDPKFTKHPATWLNQDCWLDEEPANDHRAAKPNKNDSFLRGVLAAVEQSTEESGPAEGADDRGGDSQTCLALPPPRLRA